MNSERYYHDFIKHCYNTVLKLNEDLHNIYVKRNNYANILYANINILEANGVSKVTIDNLIKGINSDNCRYLQNIQCSNEALANIIRINYNQFLYTIYTRIPRLIAIIKYYDWLSRMPYVIYNAIHRSFNKELTKYLLRGDNVNLGYHLGKLQIVRCDIVNGIDYRASYKYYQQLVSQGINPKGPNNPNGVDWKISSYNSHHWKLKWIHSRISSMIFPNQLFYKFRKYNQNKSIATVKEKLNSNNINELIDNDDISIGDKLGYMILFDNNIMDRFPPIKKKQFKKQILKDDEYIRPKSY